MKTDIIEINGINVAVIAADEIVISNVQDSLDLMADCSYLGARHIILKKENIVPDFFNLKTRVAGEILQKFSNYDMKLTIIGSFTELPGRSLKDFIYESNKTGRVSFVSSLNEAKARIAGN